MSLGTPQHMAALRAANVVRLARADAVLDSLPEYVRREEGLGKLLEGTR